MTSDHGELPDAAGEDEDIDPGWPWSFLLLVGAGGLYLIVRIIQMINDYILK